MPSSIDSWARGIVPQCSTTSLQSLVLCAEPVHIQTSEESITARLRDDQEHQVNEITDFNASQQGTMLHRTEIVQSETNTSSCE